MSFTTQAAQGSTCAKTAQTLHKRYVPSPKNIEEHQKLNVARFKKSSAECLLASDVERENRGFLPHQRRVTAGTVTSEERQSQFWFVNVRGTKG